MRDLAQDLRLGGRTLLKSPFVSALAVLSIGIAIGGNTTVFSMVDAILLRPLPFPDPDRLVLLWESNPSNPIIGFNRTSADNFLDFRDGTTAFEQLSAFNGIASSLTEGDLPEPVIGILATEGIFEILGEAPLLGRTLQPSDYQPGGGRVVVLSHLLWKNRFGANPDLVGQTIRLNTQNYTVIGVMPEGFYFPTPRVQAWVPFVFKPEEKTDAERGNEYSNMIARLKPGVTLPMVQRDLDLIQARNAQRLPEEAPFWKTSGFGGRVIGFLEQNVVNIRG